MTVSHGDQRLSELVFWVANGFRFLVPHLRFQIFSRDHETSSSKSSSVGIRRHSERCTTRSWLVEYVHQTQIRIMNLDLRSLRFHGVTSRTDTERGNMQFDFDVGRLPRISNRNSSKHICGFDSIRLPALQRGASAGSSGQFQAM